MQRIESSISLFWLSGCLENLVALFLFFTINKANLLKFQFHI